MMQLPTALHVISMDRSLKSLDQIKEELFKHIISLVVVLFAIQYLIGFGNIFQFILSFGKSLAFLGMIAGVAMIASVFLAPFEIATLLESFVFFLFLDGYMAWAILIQGLFLCYVLPVIGAIIGVPLMFIALAMQIR